ncbi:MAG: glucuronide permease, partial [Eubacteriales bacterium]|nr:glucuronide permease [Eubacteriales bacterium]
GKYVPGLMGTLFSAVDKIISSLAPMIAGVLFAAIGFKDKMPDVDTPASRELLYVGVTLAYGLILIGSLVNVVAMKFYPLTKQKMAEIQDKIAEIKAKSGYAA